MENRFKPGEIRDSYTIYTDLYLNQWDLVNQNEFSPGGNKFINDLRDFKKAYFHMLFEPILERSCVLDKRSYNSRELYVSPGQSTFWRKCDIRAFIESFELTKFIIYLFGQYTIVSSFRHFFQTQNEASIVYTVYSRILSFLELWLVPT
jgi:hypothetical protein